MSLKMKVDALGLDENICSKDTYLNGLGKHKSKSGLQVF